MASQPAQSWRRELLDMLWQDTTSRGAEQEILDTLGRVGRWPDASRTCSYYQGCRSDLITLACSAIDIHVLSDHCPDAAEKIAAKITRLAAEHLIDDLSEDNKDRKWSFMLDGRRKQVHFVSHPLEDHFFRSHFGAPLGLVFEWNCGSSAWEELFWVGVSRELVPGGHVVGSYAGSMASRDRMAFVLYGGRGNLALAGYNEGDVVYGEEATGILAHAEEQGLTSSHHLGGEVVEFGSGMFIVRGRGHGRREVLRVWRKPIAAFDLELVHMDQRICHFVKRS